MLVLVPALELGLVDLGHAEGDDGHRARLLSWRARVGDLVTDVAREPDDVLEHPRGALTRVGLEARVLRRLEHTHVREEVAGEPAGLALDSFEARRRREARDCQSPRDVLAVVPVVELVLP